MLRNAAAVDLFCGVGGLTHGLIKSGIRVLAGVDLDSTCEFAYEKNNKRAKFIGMDIADPDLPDLLNDLYPSKGVRILVGCAPCQPFSAHTQKYKGMRKDKKWGLIKKFGKVLKELEPDVVSMENVPLLQKQDIFLDFITELEEDLGYEISAEVVDCTAYGIPQKRKRLVMLASRLGPISLDPSKATSPKMTRETIGDLEPIPAGGVSTQDRLHRARGLTEINLERIQKSRPGGSWRDWDESLLAPCHRRSSGQTYSSVYARMEWDTPSPTITTQFNSFGSGRFGHPEQDRALSLREGALLQTFPPNYEFFPKDLPEELISAERLSTHIGNAVPVRLGQIIGKTIVKHILTHTA
ncbi:MAG: DNA (cytosine-5-)-methyltransferase [Chloroflexi bacterium]|jgi:DNA (cytosine-5)-methyltransferase 1|nr:DNA (cytosine-5-)-methyltransferase [Chloroflexota bacterium]